MWVLRCIVKYAWAPKYEMTHTSGCIFSGNNNLAEKGATTFQKESHDAHALCVNHIPSAKPMKTHGLQPTTTPKRHQSLFRRDRVESTVHTERKYETLGRHHRDHVERHNTSSHSSTTYYSQDVSLWSLPSLFQNFGFWWFSSIQSHVF